MGCAEGYYAVGLALRFPAAVVFAYDTFAPARELCAAMAEANGVSGRVRIGGFCDRLTLAQLPLGERALIICDCEGYELELLRDEAIPALANHDLIVESHDLFNVETTALLEARFSATHDVTEIESVDDILKAYRYDYPELAGLDVATRWSLVEEGRQTVMRWLVLRAKVHGA